MVIKVDTERHLNGEAVASRLRGDRTGGIPWMVITDADGAELITSDGPGGNVGCPATEEERAWFLEMLQRTRQHMSDRNLASIEQALAGFAKELGY